MRKLINRFRKGSGKFGTDWGKNVIKYRWPVLIVTIIMAMGAGMGGQFVGFNSDYHVFFIDQFLDEN